MELICVRNSFGHGSLVHAAINLVIRTSICSIERTCKELAGISCDLPH